MDPVMVSRGSWHYRVYRYVSDPMPNWFARLIDEPERQDVEPKAICGYFWSVVLSPVLILFAWFAGAAATVVIVPIAIVCMGIAGLLKTYKARREDLGPTKITFAASYLKARKAKICPKVILR